MRSPTRRNSLAECERRSGLPHLDRLGEFGRCGADQQETQGAPPDPIVTPAAPRFNATMARDANAPCVAPARHAPRPAPARKEAGRTPVARRRARRIGYEDADIPSLTVYLPAHPRPRVQASSSAPAADTAHLAMDHEGDQIARWLNSFGVAAFVLQYRIAPRYHYPAPLQDALARHPLVRARAGEWGVAPDRIGIMGFSAGGHLASTAGTHFDAGVVAASDPIDRSEQPPRLPHPRLPGDLVRHRLPSPRLAAQPARRKPRPETRREPLQRNAGEPQTPPTFLFHTNEDNGVLPENSVLFYLALRKNKVPAEIHIFETRSPRRRAGAARRSTLGMATPPARVDADARAADRAVPVGVLEPRRPRYRYQ